MRLSKGLVLLLAVSITMFLIGFGGGLFSAPNMGFVRVETVTRQFPVLITQTVTLVNTTTVTSTTTATATRVETYTSTVTATTTIVQTAFMPTTVTATQILTLTINMPVTTATAPFVSRGSSININDWAISVAMSYRQIVTNTSTRVVGNTTQVITTNTTYFVIVLQARNDAPWARAIDLAMLSRVILVTSSGRSYEPIAINVSKGFIAPGSYGFITLWFGIDESESPSYLYTEILTHDKPVRVEFEL